MPGKKRSIDGKSRSDPTPPEGVSYEEEAQWFHEHREYWDRLDTPLEYRRQGLPIRRTEPVTLYLPTDLLAGLKVEAERRSVPWQALVRSWLDERLAAEPPS
jgi:hypothetical protein